MADEDFDVEDLAAFLHAEPAEVIKHVERGKLPGRKVGGQWRFSRAEINLWLERRLGLWDDDDLARMEGTLEREADARQMTLPSVTELLPREAIAVPLAARTRNSAMTSMIELAAATGWLWDPAKMEEAVRSREELYSTALDNGVAMLHPRRPLASILDRPFIALGRTDGGIPFGNSRGVLTDIFFLLCSTTERGHLHTLARLSRLVSNDDFLSELRHAPDARAAHELVTTREAQLLA